MDDREDLLRYYHGELTYLRQMGSAFAHRYPKVASRLELSGEQSADPHVERLIEAFAFLTARIQRQIDSQFPEITTALLGSVCPHLVSPTPPMTIAKFDVDPLQGKLTDGYTIPRHTPLFAQAAGDLTCRFRTSYPVTLWPLELVQAAFEDPAKFEFLHLSPKVASVLHLRLEPRGLRMSELRLDRLRFYLNGDATGIGELYELLFARLFGVAILGRKSVYLAEPAIEPVGFARDEDVIPCPAHALSAYRLIQEYFRFPAKFHFFDLKGLASRPDAEDLDILILLEQKPRDSSAFDLKTFCLGCTPIVNVFTRTTEPIRLDHTQFEYPLIADSRRERTTEIHSVLSVSSVVNPVDESSRIAPFFSFRNQVDGKEPVAFWSVRRTPSAREGMTGTDLVMSFTDLDLNPSLPPEQTVYARVLCTNRELAVQLPAGAALQIEDSAPTARISCLSKPTYPAYPPMGGATLWHLVSNLSLNYHSLSDDPQSLEALRQILRLYSFADQPAVHHQVQGIRTMATRKVLRRVGTEPWRWFCSGTEITLTFDESLYEGSGAFLLGAVLHHFLPLYASVNSFTELIVKSQQRDGVWKQWPPMAGDRPLT